MPFDIRECRISDECRGAIRAHHLRRRGDHVIGRAFVGHARERAGETNRLDASLGQRAQFVSLADAVLIEILPDLELAETRIAGVERAVAVGVERDETFQIRLRARHIAGKRNLAAPADRAVAVAIEREQRVVFAHPAGLDREGVVAHRVGHFRLVDRDELEPVVVQIEHDRLHVRRVAPELDGDQIARVARRIARPNGEVVKPHVGPVLERILQFVVRGHVVRTIKGARRGDIDGARVDIHVPGHRIAPV